MSLPLIHVTCVDEATGEPFAIFETTPDELPERFEAGMILELDGDRWDVVEATPETITEAGESGQVTLVLERVQMMPADMINYSLSTIHASLPELDPETPASKDTTLLDGDDWRQFEVISPEYGEEVDAEVRDIQEIYVRGFGKHIHLRQRIETPCAPFDVTFQDLLDGFEGSKALDGVAFRQYDGCVQRGFSLRTANQVTLYGQTNDAGVVTVLGIANTGDAPRGLQLDLATLQDDIFKTQDMIFLWWPTVRPEDDA